MVPKGPQGQKRPADVIGAAIMVAKIATAVEDKKRDPGTYAKRKAGLKGGKARAKALSSEKRRAIAQKAARKRGLAPPAHNPVSSQRRPVFASHLFTNTWLMRPGRCECPRI